MLCKSQHLVILYQKVDGIAKKVIYFSVENPEALSILECPYYFEELGALVTVERSRSIYLPTLRMRKGSWV